jgi:hypothetical protein
MTTLMVIANVFAAGFILAALYAVMRLGHHLGHGQHDHRLVNFPHREHEPVADREAA